MRFNNIICISVSSHNDDQLHSIAIEYNISIEWLKTQKQNGVKKVWVPIGGGLNVAGLDTNNINDVYFFPHYLPMTSKERKFILNLKPVSPKKVNKSQNKVNTNQQPKSDIVRDINKAINQNKQKNTKQNVSLNLDDILDKINESGLSSLSEVELKFLKNFK